MTTAVPNNSPQYVIIASTAYRQSHVPKQQRCCYKNVLGRLNINLLTQATSPCCCLHRDCKHSV